MHWKETQFQGGNPIIRYSAEYAADDLNFAVDQTIAFVIERMKRFLGCDYLVFMWDSVNAILVVFGETESGELSEVQVETVFLSGQKLLEQENPAIELLDTMAENIRNRVFNVVQKHKSSYSGIKVCFLFDRSSAREDYEVVCG